MRSTSFWRDAGVHADPASDAVSADERRRAGRTMVSGFLSYRFSGLATGLAAVVAGGDRFRSRRAARALLAADVLESVWVARRLWRKGDSDALALVVDAAASIAAVVAGRANVAAADRGTFVNWAPWGFAAPAVAGQAVAAATAPARAAAQCGRDRRR